MNGTIACMRSLGMVALTAAGVIAGQTAFEGEKAALDLRSGIATEAATQITTTGADPTSTADAGVEAEATSDIPLAAAAPGGCESSCFDACSGGCGPALENVDVGASFAATARFGADAGESAGCGCDAGEATTAIDGQAYAKGELAADSAGETDAAAQTEVEVQINDSLADARLSLDASGEIN